MTIMPQEVHILHVNSSACTHVHTHTHVTSFSILSASAAFKMLIMFFGVDTTSTHQDMMNISFHYF
jgi:hypothetical protein